MQEISHLCQGPDKFLTFGPDVCADPDNFRAQNSDMYVSQSGQFGAAHGGLCQSLSGASPASAHVNGDLDVIYLEYPPVKLFLIYFLCE